MLKRIMTVSTRMMNVARFIPVILLLLCFGCGGSPSTKQVITTPPPPAPQLPPPTPGIESSYNFGMQCGIGTQGPNCAGFVLPATQAQPGCIRLHDAGTFWAVLNPAQGVYDWSTLDGWLDLVGQHEPRCMIETFTAVPCWAAPSGACAVLPIYPTGTNAPPSDLTPSGSAAFNNFVTAFVNHCSPAGYCVKDLIKFYDMWNEWDLSVHWTGTMAQVYQMVAPAAKYIKANVPSSFILMPSTTPDSDTGLGYEQDFQNWLNYENTNGHISDWITWHVYLSSGVSGVTRTPEDQWGTFNTNYLNIQQADPKWANKPWANTETNFSASTDYKCPSSQYSPQDCTGQIVRWQILHDSSGAASLDWYKWDQTIGSNPQYEAAYYNMMQYTIGGHYTAAASFTAGGGASTWTAPFVTASGGNALWVWTPNELGTSFTVPSGYVDYRDLSGNKTSVAAGQAITIGPEPFFLEQ
jgi:hypothetical protein